MTLNYVNLNLTTLGVASQFSILYIYPIAS